MNSPKITIALSILAMTAFSGCALRQMVKMAKDQQLTVKPSPLELHADSVIFDISARLPVKMLKKNKTYTAFVAYKYGDQRVEVGEVVFKQKDFPNAKTEEPTLSKRMGFKYTGKNMDRGRLLIKGQASNINDRTKSTDEMELPDDMGRGLITTNQLVQNVFYPAFADHDYDPQRDFAPTTVEFFFEQNSSKLRTIETKSNRAEFLNNFVAEKNATKQVILTGYHSPEGTEARNTVLAEARAKAIEGYYKQIANKVNPPAKTKRGRRGAAVKPDTTRPVEYITRSVVLNWNTFLDSLEVFPLLNDQQKTKVRKYIETNQRKNFEETEAGLAQMEEYQIIYDSLYPKLRTAKTEIITFDAIKTDAEISYLAQQIAAGKEKSNKLTEKQMLYAAEMTPLLNEKKDLYKASTKYADSWISHNNLGATYLREATRVFGAERTAKVNQALNQFKIAENKKVTPEVLINLAIANLMLGNTEEAALALASASSYDMNAETRTIINSLNGVTLIQAARYDEATQAMQVVVDDPAAKFNKGLAHLLKREYNPAASAFNEALALDGSYALASYGLAIVGSRTNDETAMAQNLRNAIQNDDLLRARAINDMEFLRYWKSDKFRMAVR